MVAFHNPWPAIAPSMGSYDLMYQAEHAKSFDCSVQVNGGQLYVVRSSAPLLGCVLETEGVLSDDGKLDQDAGAIYLERSHGCSMWHSVLPWSCCEQLLR